MEDPTKLSAEEARAGRKTSYMPTVLQTSVALTVLALGISLLVFAS